MKKLLLLFLVSAITFGANAQDKKFQVGLAFGPTFNWLKVNTTKIERNGVGAGFTVGLNSNLLFNQNIGLNFGVMFDLENYKLNYGSNTNTNLGDVFYAYTDTDILKYDDMKTVGPADDEIEGVGATDTAQTAFLLTTRKFKAKYVTVPIFLKFQTNKIGSMIYYGKFGLRTSFLAGVRMDDTGTESIYNNVTKQFTAGTGTNTAVRADMKPDAVKKGLTQVRTGVGIYGGAEWNFTGNTFLFGEIGFNYGITPGLYQKSSHLADKVVTEVSPGVFTYESTQLNVQSNPQHIFEIKLGILF